MTKLLIKCGFALGDIVTLTAAVRDLHRCYPGQYVTGVGTSCEEIWEHNPLLQPLEQSDPEVWPIDCEVPLINRANKRPYHCIHGFIDFLNQKLRLAIKPTEFKGDIYLSDQEKAWYSQVQELTGRPIPFWIIDAGGKYDLTIKWWDTNRYQEVVDHFRGKIQFVQVGALGHHHPPLRGVIDLRGKTNLRQLIRLVYHAQGVLCPVTGLMHLAAAVETKKGSPPLRACVVVAGGREPIQWQQYPGHQVIHTIGSLPCCLAGGCWRDRTTPLRDGDKRDGELCVDVVGNLPRCMDMITSAEVIRRIQGYFLGGVLKFLSRSEAQAAEKAVLATSTNLFDQQCLNLSSAGVAFDQAAMACQNCEAPLPSQGRGIVICAGGVRYFVNAWVCINILRKLGCKLPVEVWHLGGNEMTPRMAELLAPLGAEPVDASQMRKTHPMRMMGGWELKPHAIAYSRFRETLFLDADNVPVVNPEFLFDTEAFKKTGAIFWPDLGRVQGEKAVKIWTSCGIAKPREHEFETGQIVIDKVRCRSALQLCLWLNGNSDFYYRYVHGDKETFHLAFRKLRKSYSLVPKPVRKILGTLCQHDFDGRRIFQHRSTDKWDLFGNKHVEGFIFEQECLGYVDQLRRLWDAGAGEFKRTAAKKWRRKQHCVAVGIVANGALQESIRTEERLRQIDWGGITIPCCQGLNGEETCEQIGDALEYALNHRADFVLLMHGDLVLNKHLYHNLLRWNPARRWEVDLASLYNPRVWELACDIKINARFVDPRRLVETNALLLSGKAATCLLKRLKRCRHGDARVFLQKVRGLTDRVLFHAPSLVRRIVPSRNHGTPTHPAFDFDPEWRA